MKQFSAAILALISSSQAITTVAKPDVYGRNGENFRQSIANYDLSRIGIDRNEEGKGPLCSAPNWATFHWRAILGDGRVVDGTKERGDGRPLEITVGSRQSFNCFDIAFPELHEGDHATLHCPAFYAYGGARTVSPIDDFEIPLWSDIKFEVEMLKCDVSPHKVNQGTIYTAPHTTTLQPHRCFILRSYHEQGSGTMDFVLTNVGVEGTRTLAIEHFQTDDKDQQWFFNDRDWSIYNGAYPQLRVDSAKGINRRIILAKPDGSAGQTGFDYTKNDQMMTIEGFPFNVDHETNYVTYAGNLGGVPENWHVEYCKGEPQPRTAEDLKLTKGWFGRYYFFPGQDSTFNGYSVTGKTANKEIVETELFWGNKAEFQAVTTHVGQNLPNNQFAAEYTGQLRINRGGEYLFALNSDDGSRLTIDGNVQVENWNIHGVRRREKLVELSEGWHNVQVDYFNNNGPTALEVTYKGDDTDDIEIHIKDEIYHGATPATLISVAESTDSSESNPGGHSETNINKETIQGTQSKHVTAPHFPFTTNSEEVKTQEVVETETITTTTVVEHENIEDVNTVSNGFVGMTMPGNVNQMPKGYPMPDANGNLVYAEPPFKGQPYHKN